MREETITVTNRLGLHARAAAQLVKLAGKFKSRVILKRLDGSVTVNAKSILSVLTLAAGYGTQLLIVAEGEDEEVALNEVAGLFADRFGESA